MTSPRGTYGSGYHPSSAFRDTPIYDSLVAERGTPQIAPIRVPPPYEPSSNLPALPALPSSPSTHTPPHGMQAGYTSAQQPPGYGQAAPLQNAPAPYIPQQTTGPRGGYGTGSPPGNGAVGGYPTNGAGYQAGQAPYQGGAPAPRPVPPRPAPPRPVPPMQAPPRQAPPGQAPAPYGNTQYGRPYPGQGY